jgi:catechol 2,3-dioxygenase-like lactoylglutathione lyase family enzyme
VSRGYLERSRDRDDRRRISLELTERGRQAVEAAWRGAEAVDLQLLARVPAEHVDAMRSVLGALAEIKHSDIATGAGKSRPSRQFGRFSPILPVRNLEASLAHYAALGFRTSAYEGGDGYGFAHRDAVELHLAVDDHPEHDHAHHGASTYLYVRDADALYEEWSRPGIGGLTRPPQPTPYKLREGSHLDPDGNLIRFGSPMET